MSHYQAFDLNSEVLGQMVSSMTKSIFHNDIEDILKRHGMDNIDPQSWYPVQNLMEVFNEVSKNTSQVFISIGMASAQMSLESMPQIKILPFHTFFASFDSVWQSRHRNGDVGHMQYQRIDDNHLTMTFRSPYPDDIFYGAFYTYCREIRPKDKNFTVAFDEKVPTREGGGEVTIIHIHLI
jgi:virulence-associated protein VapD